MKHINNVLIFPVYSRI